MSSIKASLSFNVEKIADQVQFGDNVVTALEADAVKEVPLFPDLPVSVKELETLTGNLQTANKALVNGGRIAKQDAKAARKLWKLAMTKTANYISTVAAGDPQIIAIAGFIPTKGSRGGKLPIPGASESFTTTINGVKGAILAGSKKKVARAKAHVVMALPPEATATYTASTVTITIGDQKIFLGAYTGKSTELYDLKSGVAYSVSMFSINASGHGPATEPKQVRPQ